MKSFLIFALLGLLLLIFEFGLKTHYLKASLNVKI